MPITSLPLAPVARESLLKVRVTDAEKRRLTAIAASEGRSVSELVRLHLPLDDGRQRQPVTTRHPFDGTVAKVVMPRRSGT